MAVPGGRLAGHRGLLRGAAATWNPVNDRRHMTNASPMTETGYLTNQLLIAMPAMGDPNFAQTVALICDHSSRGALGLILNMHLPMRMGEIFEQLEIELATGP